MYKYTKWILDRFLALFLLLLLALLMLIIGILVKIDSKGPVLFIQKRSGKDGKEFKLYKFRSMVENNDVHDFKTHDQMTRVGKVLRDLSLDELPQLFNIIKGEMSFIGPRPWITDYSVYFTDNQRRRLEVLPGLTGYAQCSGRNHLSIKEKINLDIYYVDHVSFKMDIKVIVGTVKTVLSKESVNVSKGGIKAELDELREQWNGKIPV